LTLIRKEAFSASLWSNDGGQFSLAEPSFMPKLCNTLQLRSVEVRVKVICRSAPHAASRLCADRAMTSRKINIRHCKWLIAGGIQVSSTLKVLATVLIAGSLLFAQDKQVGNTEVTRATLDNGLRVVIVRDPLAPVVTVEQNYIVGGNETPNGFPGMAHAQEHMAFRGCSSVTADQTSAIFAQLGGDGNADTQQNITQYFSTVPAADLDIALRVDADCMRDIQDAQSEWDQEKPAIEQEVARDLSNPTYKFTTRLNEDMFSGTVYSHDPLGTKESFDATTGEMLKDFYKKWYAPNNAILVIAGDVDPSAVLAKVKEYYGSIPKKTLPPRPEVKLNPVKQESFTLESNLPYLLAFVAFRMPGTDSPDFAASQILGDVLSSQRGKFVCNGPAGESLADGIRLCRGLFKGQRCLCSGGFACWWGCHACHRGDAQNSS
jgi:zinc protease